MDAERRRQERERERERERKTLSQKKGVTWGEGGGHTFHQALSTRLLVSTSLAPAPVLVVLPMLRVKEDLSCHALSESARQEYIHRQTLLG